MSNEETNEEGSDPVPRLELKLPPLQFLDSGAPTEAATTRNEATDKHLRDTVERLDELADDMTNLLQGMKALRDGQQELAARLEAIEQTFATGARAQARELDQIRGALAGNVKRAASQHAFSAVAGTVDQLHVMLSGLRAAEDARASAQVGAVLSALRTTLRSLGYESFEVEPGADFDPNTMEVALSEAGAPGKVTRTVRPGYRQGEALARVCGVAIGSEEAKS